MVKYNWTKYPHVETFYDAGLGEGPHTIYIFILVVNATRYSLCGVHYVCEVLKLEKHQAPKYLWWCTRWGSLQDGTKVLPVKVLPILYVKKQKFCQPASKSHHT